jgi:hypothetical protein
MNGSYSDGPHRPRTQPGTESNVANRRMIANVGISNRRSGEPIIVPRRNNIAHLRRSWRAIPEHASRRLSWEFRRSISDTPRPIPRTYSQVWTYPHSAMAKQYCPSSSAAARHFATVQNKTANPVTMRPGDPSTMKRLKLLRLWRVHVAAWPSSTLRPKMRGQPFP